MMLSYAANHPKSTVELGFMSPAVALTKTLNRSRHHFKSDVVNNMDHMRISVKPHQ